MTGKHDGTFQDTDDGVFEMLAGDLGALGVSEAKRVKWIRQAKASLYQGKTGAVYRKIKELAVGSRSKKVKSHLDDFKRHRSRMQYKAFKEAGVPRGSGMVECAVRRVVNRRMKSNGTSWKERNAEGCYCSEAL